MARKAKTAQEKDLRARIWAAIFYEESLPKDWEKILDGMHLQYAMSPWHDKDVDDDGKLKKKHRHVIFRFAGVKSFSQIKAITDELNQPIPQVCKNHVGAVRYFFHLDDPEKAQYELSGYVDHGVGVESIIKLSGDTEKLFMSRISDISAIVRKFKHETLDDLLVYLEDNELDDLRYWACKNYGIVDRLCSANRWKWTKSNKSDLAQIVEILRAK